MLRKGSQGGGTPIHSVKAFPTAVKMRSKGQGCCRSLVNRTRWRSKAGQRVKEGFPRGLPNDAFLDFVGLASLTELATYYQ